MLRKFLRIPNGRADSDDINMWEVGEELGWDRGTTEAIYDYLQGVGLLKATNLAEEPPLPMKG